MKITIDIDNRQEVEAAIPLLQLIHGHKFTTGATPDAPVHITPQPANSVQVVLDAPAVMFPATTLPPLQSAQPDPAAIFGGTPAVVPGPDAAAIFGQPATLPAGAPPFVLPTGAPFTAGASPFQTAPEAQTAGAPNPQIATYLSAPPTGAPGSAPMAGATLPSNPASGVEVDAEGLPWDARIHAGTKRKNADHTWTAKRGLNDPAFVAHVKAELKALGGGQTPAPAAAPAAPFVPPAASSLPAQPGASLAPAGPPTTFEQFMARATPACLQQIIPMDAVQKAVTANGLPSVVTLQAHPEYVPQVWAYLVAQYPALGA